MFSERLVPFVITLNILIGKINTTKKRQKRKVENVKERQRRDWKGHKLRRGEGKRTTEEKKEMKKEKIRFLSKRKRKWSKHNQWNEIRESRKSMREKSEKKCKGTENYQTSYLKQLSYESCKCKVSHKFS